MSEENGVVKPNKSHSGKTLVIIAGIIVLVLAIIFGLYFGLAFVLRKINNETAGPTGNTITDTSEKLTDKNLIGTWESDCLVPDQDSKWAEKHKFVINADGTATHTRQDWAMNDCTSVQPTGLITDQFELTIPLSGKINLTYTGVTNSRMDAAQLAQFAGQSIYDIYQVSGKTLEFGHGFRGDNLSYGGKTGSSESDRFDTLNSFIIYSKK